MRFRLQILSLFIVALATSFILAKADTRTFLLDVSGSMQGLGYELSTYGKVFNNAKEQMANHIETLPDSIEVVVVPFSKTTFAPLIGTNKEIADQIREMTIKPLDSDILSAWTYTNNSKPNEKNIFFLVSDGFHNVSTYENFLDSLSLFSNKASDNEFAYLYLVSTAQRNSDIAKKFIELPHMDVTDTFDVNPFPPLEKESVIEPTIIIPATNINISDNVTDNPQQFDNWLWLLLILIIILIYICYKKRKTIKKWLKKFKKWLSKAIVYIKCLPEIGYHKYLFVINSLITKNKGLGKEIPSGNGGINKEGFTRKYITLHKTSKECIQNFINYCESKNIPFDVYYPMLLKLSRPGNVPNASIDMNVNFGCISYKLGKACSKEELKELLEQEGINSRTDSSTIASAIRTIHYDIAKKYMAKKFKITKTQAGYIIGILDFAIHEASDGTLELVPNNIHRDKSIYNHKGLISKRMKQLFDIDHDDSYDEDD